MDSRAWSMVLVLGPPERHRKREERKQWARQQRLEDVVKVKLADVIHPDQVGHGPLRQGDLRFHRTLRDRLLTLETLRGKAVYTASSQIKEGWVRSSKPDILPTLAH